MDSYKNFQRKAGHVAESVWEKGSDLLKTGKTKLTVAREEHCIDEIYYQIGATVYENAMETGDVPDYLADFYEEITARKARIAQMKADIEAEQAEGFDDDDEGEEVIIDITPEPKPEPKAEDGTEEK